MAGFFWPGREIARLSVEAAFVAQEFLNPHRDQPVFVSPEQDRVPYDQDFPERVPDVQERAFLLIFFFRPERERRLQVIPLVLAVRDEVDLCLLPAAGAAFAFSLTSTTPTSTEKPRYRSPLKIIFLIYETEVNQGLKYKAFKCRSCWYLTENPECGSQMNSCLWKAVGFLEISYNKVEKENADLKKKMRVKKIVLIVIGCIVRRLERWEPSVRYFCNQMRVYTFNCSV